MLITDEKVVSLSPCSSPAAAMMPPSWTRTLLAALLLLPMMTTPVASAAEPESCFFRQHQNANVNIRLAASRPGTAAEARAVWSEQACIRACCSQEVKPGG